MQSGCKGGICGHSASAFGNSVSMPIVALGLSGHCNGYRATVAMICNMNGGIITIQKLCSRGAFRMITKGPVMCITKKHRHKKFTMRSY